MKRAAGIGLFLFLSLPCAVYGASKGSGMTVTPLDDEFAGQSAPLYTPPGPVGQRSGQAGTQNGAGPSGATETAAPAMTGNGSASSGSLTPGGDTKDSLVIAYLIDLARKQTVSCPAGATPPAPPSLLFSEPLCKAARAVQGGAEPLAAMETQGIHAAKWRMFSADNAPAQRVVNGLRQVHCEALLEPYTHIGAYRDSGGWKILLATLDEKPAEGATAAQEAGPVGGAAPPPQSGGAAGGSSDGAGASQQAANAASVPLAGGAASGAALGGFESKRAEPAANMSGQEARSLFMLLNELRAKGGACFGKDMPPAPALAFSAELQAAAEKDVQASSASGAASDPKGGMLYKGSNVTKLTLKANNHASVALDVWMVSPSQCETLLSPLFTDAGAAYENERWVLMLGGRNKGVPSDK